MIKPLSFVASAAFLLVSSLPSLGQARPTADRVGDLQVGISYTGANGDYAQNSFRGLGFYATFDMRHHFGVVGEFHQLNDSKDSGQNIYERTYEIGGRYLLHYGPVHPYAKALYGRGVFNFEENIANLAYNIGAAGVGADINVHKHINVNVDYEYQRWFGFPPSAISPQLVTVGVAYHF